MNPRPDEWRDRFFLGWPSMIDIYFPSPLPPEFREENQDLNTPRSQEQDLERLENYMIFRPFF